jgi:hypothetical protein
VRKPVPSFPTGATRRGPSGSGRLLGYRLDCGRAQAGLQMRGTFCDPATSLEGKV